MEQVSSTNSFDAENALESTEGQHFFVYVGIECTTKVYQCDLNIYTTGSSTRGAGIESKRDFWVHFYTNKC